MNAGNGTLDVQHRVSLAEEGVGDINSACDGGHLAWNPSGTILAASCSEHLYIVNAEQGVVEHQVLQGVEEMGLLAFNPSGSKLADASIRVERFGCRATESFESLQLRIRSKFCQNSGKF